MSRPRDPCRAAGRDPARLAGARVHAHSDARWERLAWLPGVPRTLAVLGRAAPRDRAIADQYRQALDRIRSLEQCRDPVPGRSHRLGRPGFRAANEHPRRHPQHRRRRPRGEPRRGAGHTRPHRRSHPPRLRREQVGRAGHALGRSRHRPRSSRPVAGSPLRSPSPGAPIPGRCAAASASGSAAGYSAVPRPSRPRRAIT